MSDDTLVSILVVDDNKETRRSLSDLLTHNKYSITEASDKKEALRILETGEINPSFVLVDQIMDGPETGMNLVKEIRKRWSDIFIVMYTANPRIEDWQKWQAIHAGAHRYIRKASAQELLRDVDEIIRDMRELQQLTQEFKEITHERMAMASALVGLDVGVTLIDREYRILFTNRQQIEIVGANKKVSSPCWTYLHDYPVEQGPCTFCIVKATLESQKSQTRDFLFRVASDKLEWVKVHTVPIFAQNPDGSKRVIAVKEASQRIGNAVETKNQNARLQTIARGIVSAGYGRARIYEAINLNLLKGRAASAGPDKKTNHQFRINTAEREFSIINDSFATKAKNEKCGTLFTTFNVERDTDSISVRELIAPCIDMPIWHKDGLAGWLSVDVVAGKKTKLDKQDIEYLRPFAEEVRRALVEVPGDQRVDPRLRETVAKARINVSTAQNNDEALSMIMEAILEFVPCHKMWVRIKENNHLRLLKQFPVVSQSLIETISVKNYDSFSAYVARSTHALYINDMGHYRERIASGEVLPRGLTLPVGKSFAAIPLIVEWVCFGTLCIDPKKQTDWDQPGLKPALAQLASLTALLLYCTINSRKEAAERELMQAFGAIHGIKGPASAIRNYLQLILGSYEQGNLKLHEAIKYVSAAARSLTRIERLADRLLRLVRPRKEPLRRIDTHNLFKACAQESRDLSPQITVTYRVESGAEGIYCGQSEFRAVLDELITNSARAMDGTGHINITASCDGGNITISVEDDGPGVQADELERIFTRWYSGFGGGTGLGLSFVRTIVKDLGGHVFAELPQKGMRIVIRLPKADPDNDSVYIS